MNQTADVVIVGAGSSGTALAYYLAQKGLKQIVILERQGVGAGATGQAAGLIRHHYPERALVRMVRYSSEKMRHFAAEMGYGIDFVGNGFLFLTPPGSDEVLAQVKMQREEGVNVEVLMPRQVADIHPRGKMGVEGIGYGILDHDGAYADPYKLAAGYCERARDLGVQLQLGVTVTGFVTQGARITAVETNRGAIRTGLVVNAAGLGADALNRSLGIELPLRNFSLGHALLIPDQPFAADILTVNDASRGDMLYFFRPESGGTVLVGMDQDDPEREFNPATYYMDVPFDKMGRLYEFILSRLPFAANYRLTTEFGALDVKSPDWNPGLGFWREGPENYYQIVAGSGHAFKFAPAFGLVAAEQILGEPLSFDMSSFEINRFHEFSAADFSGSFFVDQ